jgi:hypothetical protein
MTSLRGPRRLAAWIRDLFAPRRKPYRRPSLQVESLEDRTVLDLQGFAIGPMYLYGDFFMDTQNNWWAKGEVKLGFAPAPHETFDELAVFSTTPDGKVWFSPTNPNPEFTVEKAELISMVSVPNLTIWETDGTATFNAAILASPTGGVNIYSGARPFTVEAGQFTLDNIRFVDPDGDGEQKGEIWMQGSLSQAPLTGLSLTVAGSNFVKLTESGVVLTGVAQAVSGGLTIGGLGFTVNNLSVSYSAGTFTLTGSAQISLAENESVQVIFASPGLQISGGEILTFPLVLNSDLTFSGVKFATKNLRFNYAHDTFTLTGQVAATIGSQSLTVTFGQGGTAGLKIVNGELTNLDMMFQGNLNLLGLQVQMGTRENPITITYSQATGSTPSLFTLSGKLAVPELWNAAVILGSAGHPGLVVQGGDFQLEDVKVELADVNLGAFTIDELLVAFTSDTFAVTLDVWIPAGWKVHGYVQFEDGKLNSIDFGLEGNQGIEIADTGIMITGFEGGIFNLQHPADLILTGKLEAVWLSQNFVKVEGDFTIDRDELVLHGNISFLDGMGQGDVRLVLDWGEQDYSAIVKVDWLDGMLQFDAIMDIHDGDSVYVKAKADVNVPDDIPFIGGQTLAEIDFVLEWRKDRPDSENFVAAWVDLDFFFFSIDVGVKVDFTGHVSLIGSSFINSVDSPPPDTQPKVYHYRIPFTVPENVTQGTLQVKWPEIGGNQSVAIVLPNGTTVPQSQFTDPSRNLTLLPSLTSRQSVGVGMAGSSTDPFVTLTPGTYQLVLTSNYKFSKQPSLTTSFGTARPTIATPQVQPPTSLTTPITLSGRVASSLGPNARVTLYVDRDNTGYDGTPIPEATSLPVTVDAQGHWTVQVNWSMDGLMPWQYFVYASINDGVSAPVHSAYSAPVTPNPALYGTVSTFNQGLRESGLLIFVDHNGNQQFDPGIDPYTSTNDFGLYSFDSSKLPLNTPFYVGLILPYGFQMHGGSPSLVQVGPYNGIDGLTVNFQVDEFAAIHGQVTADFDAGSQPLVGWTVYLDANNNGQLDADEVQTLTTSDGSYVFRKVPLGTTQIVRLVPTEGYYLTGFAGRVVNVTNDPFEIYRHNDFTALPFSTISGTITGYGFRNGTLSSTAGPQAGVAVNLLQPAVLLNPGGSATGNYLADPGPSGGTAQIASNFTQPIDLSRIPDPAPQIVYQSNRYGTAFSYTLADLKPNASYLVRLHFAELYWSAAGQRLFNVAINGQTVLSNYDIFAQAGGAFVAVAESFTATADANGTITITFTTTRDNAQINGIEVSEIVATTTTDANGNYSFGGLKKGTYTVAQVLPAGWREVAPFTSNFHLQLPSDSDQLRLPTNLPGYPQPIDVAVADFDGDGQLDIAVLHAVRNQTNNQSYVYIYYNGAMDHPVRYGLAYGTNYFQMVVGDFWGTGRANIAVFGQTEQRYHARVDVLPNVANSRTNNFGSMIWGMWQLQNYSQGPLGQITLVPHARGTSTSDQLAVFYYDQHGNPTLALFGHTTNGVTYSYPQLNDPASPQQMLSVDVNNDGYSDLIISDLYRSLTILFGGSGGTLSHALRIDDLPSARHVLAADINGDGTMDLGVFDTNGMFHYATQDQMGNFTVIRPDLGWSPDTVGSALFQDVNGDLLPDLVWVADAGSMRQLHVVLNSGRAGAWFTPAGLSNWGELIGAAGPLVASDLDKNGLSDLIVNVQGTSSVFIFRNHSVLRPTPITVTVDGNTSTANNFVNAQMGQVGGKVFADVDRDGKLTGHEPGLAGVTVYVDLNRNGRLDRREPSMVTGPHGLYGFSGLTPGRYPIRVVPHADYRVTSPDAAVHHVQIRPGAMPQLDQHFANVATRSITIPIPERTGVVRLVRQGDRIEVVDRVRGVMASYALADLHAITVRGPAQGRGRLVLDLAHGGTFVLPGGITFQGGTGSQDSLRVVLGSGSDQIHIADNRALLNGQSVIRWTDVEGLAVDGGAGDDVLRVHGRPLPWGMVILDGETGNDTYNLGTRNTFVQIVDADGDDTLDFGTALAGVRVDLGLSADSVQRIDSMGNRLQLLGTLENVIGSPFADQLLGNVQRNILIGGTGADLLSGADGDDLLIAGHTAFVRDPVALRQVAAEWKSARSYTERLQNLSDGTGSTDRQNGDTFLTDATISFDLEANTLQGGLGMDWFLGGVLDRIRGLELGERSGW